MESGTELNFNLKFSKTMNKKSFYFVTLFAVIGLIALQIPIFKMHGAKAAFTLYDFLSPISGSFIGTIPGMLAVFSVQILNVMLFKSGVWDTASIVRLFPVLFGVWYFSKKDSRVGIIVPLLAMLVFNLHPQGRAAWMYSLYNLIPIVCYALRDRFLFARSLGATFTQHGVGGALWVWTFNMPAAVWISLIPQVAMERLAMAIGIMIAYRVFVNVLYALEKRKILSLPFSLEQRFIFTILK